MILSIPSGVATADQEKYRIQIHPSNISMNAVNQASDKNGTEETEYPVCMIPQSKPEWMPSSQYLRLSEQITPVVCASISSFLNHTNQVIQYTSK